MIRSLRKTGVRSWQFLEEALTWRGANRQHALLAWGMLAGVAWLAFHAGIDSPSLVRLSLGIYLLAGLVAICAIDARFGIIPDSLLLGLLAGGLCEIWLSASDGVPQRLGEAVLAFGIIALFQAAYRRLKGYDGLGFGDVKFVGVAVLWIGIERMPELLLLAVASALVNLLLLKVDGHRLDRRSAISFGPHLAFGLWIAWIDTLWS